MVKPNYTNNYFAWFAPEFAFGTTVRPVCTRTSRINPVIDNLASILDALEIGGQEQVLTLTTVQNLLGRPSVLSKMRSLSVITNKTNTKVIVEFKLSFLRKAIYVWYIINDRTSRVVVHVPSLGDLMDTRTTKDYTSEQILFDQVQAFVEKSVIRIGNSRY